MKVVLNFWFCVLAKTMLFNGITFVADQYLHFIGNFDKVLLKEKRGKNYE